MGIKEGVGAGARKCIERKRGSLSSVCVRAGVVCVCACVRASMSHMVALGGFSGRR